MNDNKINRDTAVSEFERFADLMCLDVDKTRMRGDDVDSFEEQKETIVKAIMQGDLVINDTGEPVYTPVRSDNKDPITFYEPTGATLAASDRRGKNQDVIKMYEMIGEMTKTHAAKFSRMKNYDLKVCQAVYVFFLA